MELRPTEIHLQNMSQTKQEESNVGQKRECVWVPFGELGTGNLSRKPTLSCLYGTNPWQIDYIVCRTQGTVYFQSFLTHPFLKFSSLLQCGCSELSALSPDPCYQDSGAPVGGNRSTSLPHSPTSSDLHTDADFSPRGCPMCHMLLMHKPLKPFHTLDHSPDLLRSRSVCAERTYG